MKNIGVLTSGGDSPGMNAAIRAIVRTAAFYGVHIYGISYGYKGIYEQKIRELNVYSVADIIQRGGTILYSARCEEMLDPGGTERAAELLGGNAIDSLIVIGGDGSYRGALALSQLGINVMTLPGTIDNDIACTDFSIGFDTALNTAIDAISKIRDTSHSHNRVNVVEVMGRRSGNIALYAGLAGGAENIVVPEIPYNIDKICEKMLYGKDRGKLHSIIVFAEGAGDIDTFCREIEDKSMVTTRKTTLGYIQRGGSPSAFDRVLASRMGAMAVDLLVAGDKNKAVCYKNNEYISADLGSALNMKYNFNTEVYDLAMRLSL